MKARGLDLLLLEGSGEGLRHLFPGQDPLHPTGVLRIGHVDRRLIRPEKPLHGFSNRTVAGQRWRISPHKKTHRVMPGLRLLRTGFGEAHEPFPPPLLIHH